MVKQLVIILVLLLLFALLAVTYYLLTRPPEVEGSAEDRDRRFLFSIYGFEGDLLRRPTGVGIDSRGNIHVADTGKRRIAVFDSSGRFVRVYGEAGKGDLLIYDPIDVAITPDGRAWVVDKTQGKIVEFDVTGRAVRDIVTPELPLSITYADENLFVTVESGVLVADLDGNLLTGYVRRGKEAGSFDRPGGVAVGEDHGVHSLQARRHGREAELRPGVYEEDPAVGGRPRRQADGHARAIPPIARVPRRAHLAPTADHRDAMRRAGAKKDDFHIAQDGRLDSGLTDAREVRNQKLETRNESEARMPR
jgi:hypothetical protein